VHRHRCPWRQFPSPVAWSTPCRPWTVRWSSDRNICWSAASRYVFSCSDVIVALCFFLSVLFSKNQSYKKSDWFFNCYFNRNQLHNMPQLSNRWDRKMKLAVTSCSMVCSISFHISGWLSLFYNPFSCHMHILLSISRFFNLIDSSSNSNLQTGQLSFFAHHSSIQGVWNVWLHTSLRTLFSSRNYCRQIEQAAITGIPASLARISGA
jgi:hypothetical protein